MTRPRCYSAAPFVRQAQIRRRDAAWRAFNGWRVNYDTVLLHLAGLTAAPPAHWSGDRAIPDQHPPLRSFFQRSRVQPPASLER